MKHKINILNGDYVNNPRPEIHLFGRDENFNLHHLIIINFKPYFFINEKDYIEKKELIDSLLKENFSIEKTNLKPYDQDSYVYKLTTKIPSDVKDLRENLNKLAIKNYEADVLFLTRFIIDLKLFKGLEYDDKDLINIYDEKYISFEKIKPINELINSIIFLTLDIETLDSEGFPSKTNPYNKINALSFYNEHKKTINQFILKPKKILDKDENQQYKKTKSLFELPREYTKKYYDDLNILLKTNLNNYDEISKYIVDNIGIIDKDYIDIITNHIIKLRQNGVDSVKKEKRSIDDFINTEIKKILFEYDDEVEMLKDVVVFLSSIEWDILTAYNGNEFDFPYLFGRMQRLKINFSSISPMSKYTRNCAFVSKEGKVILKCKTLFDSLDGVKKLTQSELSSYSLNNVSKTLFDTGKVDYKSQYGGISKLYYGNYNMFIKYNLMDTLLEYSVIKEKKLIWFFYFVKTVCGVDLNDVMFNTRIVDALFLRKARERNEVLPSKIILEEEKEEDDIEKIEGAIVVIPKEKILFDIEVFDISQSYPSGAITVNLGAEKIVLDSDQYNNLINSETIEGIKKTDLIGSIYLEKENKYIYIKKDKIGIIADLFSEMTIIRDQLKKIALQTGSEIDAIIQEVFKFIVNTIYGALLYQKFRLYDRINGAIITAIGRDSIKIGIEILENMLGKKVKYGDTDSLYSKSNKTLINEIVDDAKNSVKVINTELSKRFIQKYNVKECRVKFDFEKVYKKLIFKFKKDSNIIAKKMYAGKLGYYKGKFVDKIDIKGLIKSDIPEIAIDMRNIIFKNIFDEKLKENEIRDKIINELRLMFKKIRKIGYEAKYISFAKSIRKELDEYGNQDWIRGARWFNYNCWKFGINYVYGSGSKPKFLYVSPNMLTSILNEKKERKYDSTDIVALDDNDNIPNEIYKCLDVEKTLMMIGKKIDDIIDILNIKIEDIVSDVKNIGLW